MKVFHFLKREWRTMLLIFLLLVAQASCEMALPSYMSSLVDVGIQQGGVQNAAAEKLSAASYQDLRLFLTAQQQATLDAAYAGDGEIYTLKALDKAQLEALDELLRLPMAVLYMMAQQGNNVALSALRSALVSADQALSMAQAQMEKQGGQSDNLLRQAAVQFVRKEYKGLGIDVDRLQQNYLWQKGLLMIGVTLLMGLAAIMVGYFSSRTSARIGRDLRSQVYHKVIGFSKAEIDRFSTASLITRTGNDIRQVEQSSGMIFRIVLYAPIMGVIGVWRVAQLRSGLSWIVILAVLCAAGMIGVLAGRALPKFKIMQKLIDRQSLVFREILTGLPVIRAFTRERFEEDRFDKANKDVINVVRFIGNTFTFLMPAMMFIMNAVMLLIIWFGAKGIDQGQLQVGAMMAMITYTMYIVMSFMMLSMAAVMLPRANVSTVRILEVLNTDTSIKDPADPVDLGEKRGEITFDHVSFRYPDAQEDILHDLNFTASPGQTTAIIGGTGSGKSTVISLIPRLYDVTGGSILIDGMDIRYLRLKDLRAMIGYVPQQGVLFSGDIASNIKYADPDASDELMQRAARIAQAEDFIKEKQEGYASSVARGGNNVSGGQKQRLSIARAIAKEPRILMFDDSFSALDYRTDLQLRQALRREMRETTVLIVAQRIATVLKADKILVLENGRIMGEGRHAELMADCPAYRAIAESQLSAEELKGGAGL
ncbi:MAG: ABC transporter ATP-binding protein [Christensenellales bacterium]